MKFVLYKVNNDKVEEWENWCSTLHTIRRKEAIDTLEEEDVLLESFFNFQINNEWYALGCSLTYENQDPKPSNKSKEINILHAKVKNDCLKLIDKGTSGYSLYADSLRIDR